MANVVAEDKDNLTASDDRQEGEQSDDQAGSDAEERDEASGEEGDDQEADSTAPVDGTVAVTDNAAAVPEDPQAQQQPQGFNMWGMMKTLLIRMVVIYMISSFLRRGQTPAAPEPGAEGQNLPASRVANPPASNIFPRGTLMDVYMYISEKEVFSDFNDEKSLFWLSEELEYGDWTSGPEGDGIFLRSAQIPVSEKVQNNGTLYLHIYVVKSGFSPNPLDKDRYNKRHTIYKSRELTRMKKRRYHKMKNLLTGTSQVQADLLREHNESSYEIISHWHPNLTINIIDDHTGWVKGSIPSPLDEYIDFVPDATQYYPIVYFNDYWNLNSEHTPINTTTPVLNLTVTYQPMSLFKWQMYAAQGMRSRWYSFLGDDVVEGSDEDQDSLKQAFLETSPYLLAITVVVSIVHSIFEFLAFKNDIQFWRNRKSLEGLSVRSVFFNVFQSVVVLLYVLDNETNFVIKVSIFVGLGIEIWKIHKVIDIKVDRENKLFGLVPRVWFQDKSTYAETATKEYDRMAFKYLSWLLFPLLGGYAVYSILYLEHRGWYSWVLGMMYGFLLTFGFIAMTPQLFINYKLKSVAHLPWRMLTYKALNTFIDDLFAFVIKMPMLYRLGCFRDDIVFLIYVYQRWIYRVDPKRYNEFGTSGEMNDEQADPALQNGSAVVGAIEAAANQDVGEGVVVASTNHASQKSAADLQQRSAGKRVKSKQAKKAD